MLPQDSDLSRINYLRRIHIFIVRPLLPASFYLRSLQGLPTNNMVGETTWYSSEYRTQLIFFDGINPFINVLTLLFFKSDLI